jgi:hypothetical protein
MIDIVGTEQWLKGQPVDSVTLLYQFCASHKMIVLILYFLYKGKQVESIYGSILIGQRTLFPLDADPSQRRIRKHLDFR